MVLLVGAALVAALVVRLAPDAAARRRLALVAGVALGLRVLAVTVIYLIAIRTHDEGTWLNDEASFYLATESLLPSPFDGALPQGLGHLGGNAYLGLLTVITVALGHMDTVAYRLANATLGTLVALLAAALTARFVHGRAGLVAGLVVGVWPTLILWSATFLRDTLASFVALAVWWTLASQQRLRSLRVICVVVLALELLSSLRPHLAAAAGAGVLAWAVYPTLARLSGRSRLLLALGGATAVVVVLLLPLRIPLYLDQAAHQLVYRQTTTRMETLGRLYVDVNPDLPPVEQPFAPGVTVALIQSGSNWLLTGLVREPVGPGLVSVAFTDGSIRTLPTSDLTLLQSAPLSPIQIVASLGPGLAAFLSGLSSFRDDSSSPVWMIDALAWDVLFVLAVLGGVRARVPIREWLFPTCIVLGTALALVSVPGAPGNDDRHRAAQTVPILVVFGAGWLASRRGVWSVRGLPVRTAMSSPATAPTPAASRTRSPR